MRRTQAAESSELSLLEIPRSGTLIMPTLLRIKKTNQKKDV